MFVIGIDPHRGSHAAAVLDGDERVRAVLQLPADRQQRQRLLSWASEFAPRLWAVEGATGTGALARPAARRRRRAGGRRATEAGRPGAAAGQRPQRQDRHPRRPLDRHRRPAQPPAATGQPRGPHGGAAAAGQATPRSDRGAHPGDLPAAHHGVLPRRRPPAPTSTGRTGRQDPGRHPPDHGDRRRTQGAGPGPARRGPPPRPRARRPPSTASATPSPPSGTTLTELHGVGPIVAAYLLGYSGDIGRFPSAGHYARYNATAPIEASSGPVIRHRLNPRGNRQLNHAIHMIAVTQVRNDTPGRAYYLRKQAEGHSRKEAMRALKRRISDAVYRQLVIDSRR